MTAPNSGLCFFNQVNFYHLMTKLFLTNFITVSYKQCWIKKFEKKVSSTHVKIKTDQKFSSIGSK